MHPAPQETEAALFTALPEALPWRGRPPGAAPIHSFLEGPSSTRPRGQQGLRPPASVELLPEAGDGMPRRPDTADSEARRPTMGEVASTVPGGQRAWITPQKAPRSSRMKRVKPGNAAPSAHRAAGWCRRRRGCRAVVRHPRGAFRRRAPRARPRRLRTSGQQRRCGRRQPCHAAARPPRGRRAPPTRFSGTSARAGRHSPAHAASRRPG